MVERIKGIKPDELINPAELPLFLEPLWQDFLNLNQSRQAGMAINPLTYSEIDAYARLTKTTFSKSEVLVIKQLDSLLLKQHSSKG